MVWTQQHQQEIYNISLCHSDRETMSGIFTVFLQNHPSTRLGMTKIERQEICYFLLQLTIPFHLQSKHQIAVSLFIKMDIPNIAAFASLPTDRQEVMLLQVFSRKGTNRLTILQAAARDMDFVMGQIAQH